MTKRTVFITGGTGFMGRSLIPELLRRGHEVRALVRRGSEAKLPAGCTALAGDPLDAETFINEIGPADTFVQLVGVAHPSPAKAKEFRAIDLKSASASIRAAAAAAGVRHFVYVSVAQPAPIMKAYLEARAEAESLLRASGLNATVLRPWYVLGPGRQWPRLLKPFYWLMERIPSKRETARRLGLMTDAEMRGALVYAVENPAEGIRILSVPEIKEAAREMDRNS